MLKTDTNPNGVDQSVFDEMTKGMKKDRAEFFTQFFRDFFGAGFLSQPVSDEVMHWAWGVSMSAGLRPTLACAKAFATTDFRPDLASFRVPTLVLHGT
ncbi:alpha/beta fold hydrolase, partial [Shinella sp.]|uniref:alpha/beta fold hydrolase n=1 Tax=Shinella sp. TaxID=1870904 RepID=UPI003F72A003